MRKISRKAQEVKISKRNFPCSRHKRAQEEMVGFALILIIIAVITLVFVSLSKDKGSLDEQNFEVGGFLNALMEKTTSCEKNADFIAVKDLIFECGRGYECQGGEDSCDVLEETVKDAMKYNWEYGENNAVKGYSILVYYEDELLVNETQGSTGTSSRGAKQEYAKTIENAEAFIEIYN